MSRLRSKSGRIAVVILGLALMGSGVGRPERRQAFVDPLLVRMMRASEKAARDTGRPESIPHDEVAFFARVASVEQRDGGLSVGLRLRLDAAARHAIEALGIRTYGRLDGFASAVVPIQRLREIAALPGVDAMQARRVPEMELNVSRAEVQSTLVETNYASRGKGVIVGSVDTGIDWRNQDFRNPDGTTRIKYLWTQVEPCTGTSPPYPFDFGCLYTAADINAALLGGPTITAPDAVGHGTFAMAVAAGNGRATGQGYPAGRYVGMAPEADIIMVKSSPEPGATCDTCNDIGLGMDFIDAKAAEMGRPYVINLSLGIHDGGHDGSDMDEMTIDTLVGPGIPGKAIVKSAGNDRGHAIHIGGVVAAGQTVTHNFTFPLYTPSPGDFTDAVAWSLWYSNGDNLTVTIADPSSIACGTTPPLTLSKTTGQSQVSVTTSSGFMLIDDVASPAPNGARFFEMQVTDQGRDGQNHEISPCQGTWQLQVKGNTITAGGRYDAWIWYSRLGGGTSPEVVWATLDDTRTVSLPGTAFNVTTVGAYTSKLTWQSINGGSYQFSGSTPVGALTSYSSPGPTRDGRIKPDIGAPGSAIVSSLSADAAPGLGTPYIVEDGVHRAWTGTSFSAPHVAGIYAQILALNPILDAIDLRKLATGTARADVNTGTVPNNNWGYGKVSALGMADRAVQKISDVTVSSAGMFSWTALATATSYNAYRGNLSLKGPGYYGSCLQPGLSTPTFTDTAVPPVGGGYFYLFTGVWNGVEGTLGYTSNGTLRINSSPCP